LDQPGIGDIPQESGAVNDRALVAFVEGKLDECRRSANWTSHQSVWMTNVAWTLGYQNMVYSSQDRMYRQMDMTFGTRRRKLQTNRILPTLQNRTARLCKNPPRYEVRPNTSEIEDKEATELAKMIIDHYWDSENLNRKRIDLYMWKQQCGHSYIKVVWDPSKGRRVQDPITGESMNEGDIRIDVVSSFEVYPDPKAKSLEEAQYIVETRIRDLEYFKTEYPGIGDFVKEEQATLMGLQYQTRINSMNSFGTAGDSTPQVTKNCAIEKSYYERPSAKYPQGRLIVEANGILLANKELAVGEMNWVKFDDVIVAGKYTSEAIVTHMVPVQEQINLVINKRNDWINKCMFGKYSVARGAGLSQEAMNDQHAEVAEYDVVPNAPDGGRPMPIPVPHVPNELYTEEERLLDALYEIAGISDVARGEIPSSSISGVGMEILLQADATRIGLVTEADELSWAKVGRLILLFAQKYISNERLLKQSSDQGYRVKAFVGSDIKDNTDVLVVRGSTLPNSLISKRNDINNLYQMGLLGLPTDPEVQEKVLSMLEFGDVQKAWNKQNLKQMQMKKVITKLEQGIPSVPTEFDDSAYWLQKLDEYRLSDKFDRQPPQVQQMLMSMMDACVTATMPPSHKAPAQPVPNLPDQPVDQPLTEPPTPPMEQAPQ
jgi:hypothetical protein